MKWIGVQDKSLEEILQAIMDKSALLCPAREGLSFLKREETIASTQTSYSGWKKELSS